MRAAISTAGNPPVKPAAVPRRRPRGQQGYTYLVALIAVALLAIFAETQVTVVSTRLRAEREAELLFRGQAYRNAIRGYYEAGQGVKTYPQRLEDLLHDPRYVNKRHLRQLYPDPMQAGDPGAAGWEIIPDLDGGIRGIASRSRDEPLKKAGFPPELEGFADAANYSDWVFEYIPEERKRLPGAGRRSTVPADE
ncbi:MAG TPA: type II secretion system protein [Gammaproteobacteria bacterium]|nr:type II secretion system protein [Gammaproteobacteria bacterium]